MPDMIAADHGVKLGESAKVIHNESVDDETVSGENKDIGSTLPALAANEDLSENGGGNDDEVI